MTRKIKRDTINLERGDGVKKSVYSIVLMDDIIEAIDTLAYSMNTSRSNLINQILAEKVAVVTPEMHMQDVFDTMEKLLNGYSNFQVQSQASDTMISIRSVLRYKYNPTIRYAVNLYRGQDDNIGELKVISRTQSGLLYEYLTNFFEIWIKIEEKYDQKKWDMEQGAKWSRKLLRQDEKLYTPEEIAEAISDYIKVLDEGLKIYLIQMSKNKEIIYILDEHYYNYYKHTKIKL